MDHRQGHIRLLQRRPGGQVECGDTEYGQPRIIRVYQDAPTNICGANGEYLHKILMHEMGHTIGLHHITRVDDPGHPDYANAQACRATKAMMTDVPLNDKKLSEEVDCKFAHEFLRDDHPVDCTETPEHEDCTDDDDDGDDPDGGDPDVGCSGGSCRPDDDDDDDETDECALSPKPGCPGYCDLNPFHRDCPPDCKLFPLDPRCGDVTYEVCWGEYQDVDGDGELECVPAENLRIGGDGKNPVVITATSASSRDYRIRLDHGGTLGVTLSGMSRDFNCKVYESGSPPNNNVPRGASGSTPTWGCTNLSGTLDDSLERSLPAGTHTLSVYPSSDGTGDYTLTVTYAAGTLPSPIAKILPFTSEVTTDSSSTFRFSLTESTDVTVSISELTADFDCRVEPETECSNNRGTLDDSWSGTLGSATHSLTVYPHDGASGFFKLAVYRTGEPPPADDTEEDDDDSDDDEDDDEDDDDDPDPPGAPSLSGSVTVTKHTLTWTAPTSSTDITGYRLQSRSSATANWSSPTGGSATASSLSATTLTWNIATSASAVRFYRVAASNEDGEGPWSNEIKLTSDGPPAQVSITGSVSNRTQTVSWTAPLSDSAITKYQLQTRSARGSWRWPGSGSPTASNMPATTRSWSVNTPAGMTRHYRVRAVSALGDGAWSSHVELTSASPPPLSAPSIPNFDNLASARTVNTTFPVATGGTPPYSYSLSGLPPGITFNASTRVASGTLPIVSRRTTYNLTYTVTDSARATDSESFTATVVPPAKPAAPTLSGSVTRQTQSLSWTAPTSSVPITGYQLQVRNSSTSRWRCTSAGSAGASCSLSASTTSWSVTTPAGMTRHYRVRASNAGGSGSWSNEVVLTSGGG